MSHNRTICVFRYKVQFLRRFMIAFFAGGWGCIVTDWSDLTRCLIYWWWQFSFWPQNVRMMWVVIIRSLTRVFNTLTLRCFCLPSLTRRHCCASNIGCGNHNNRLGTNSCVFTCSLFACRWLFVLLLVNEEAAQATERCKPCLSVPITDSGVIICGLCKLFCHPVHSVHMATVSTILGINV